MKEAILVFDVSGSIDSTKKDYYKDICNHYRNEYKISTVITYTTTAKKFNCFSDRDFDRVISKPEAGGTYTSSGLVLATGEALKSQGRPTVVLCGDGDNWFEDNNSTYNVIRSMKSLGIEVIYHEILPTTYSSPMSCRFKKKNLPCKIYIVNGDCDIFGKSVSRYETMYFVQHTEDGKLYEFRSDSDNFCVGEFVTCETSQGNTYGRIREIYIRRVAKDEYNNYGKIRKA